MRLWCPFNDSTVRCSKTVEIRDDIDNPPFFYSRQTGIDKMIEHINRDHSVKEIITFFEDYMVEKILQSSEGAHSKG